MDIPFVLKMLHLKPRVVHRLPGRLRVHIPALRHVSIEFQKIVDILLTKFSFPEGIIKVTINYISGNLLILYDKDSVYEKAVLDWLSDLATITGQIWVRFIRSDNGNGHTTAENLLHFFLEASKNGNILNKNFIIPNYVWS
jgi:hypothetical protein